MQYRAAMVRSGIQVLAASGGLAIAILAGSASPTAAECDGPAPSIRHALLTAARVVIGDVTAVQGGGLVEPGPDGRSSRFTLRVRYVLRGEASAEMDIRDLPTQPCAPGVEARVGDRLALAFDATDFSPPIPVNAVGWIRGSPPNFADFETITLIETFRLLGQSPPDTAIAEPARSPDSPGAPFVLLASALVGLMFGWRGFAQRASRFREP